MIEWYHNIFILNLHELKFNLAPSLQAKQHDTQNDNYVYIWSDVIVF